MKIADIVRTEQYGAENIYQPYDLIPWSAKSKDHLGVIDSWARHLKKKDWPYVVEETDVLARLVTQQSARVFNGYLVPVEFSKNSRQGYYGD